MGSAGFAHTTVAYSTAVAVSVPGEVALYIVATEIVTLIAPSHAIGTYHGAFGSTFAGSVIAAPLLAGGAMALGGNRLAGLAVMVCGLLATLLCLPLAVALRAPRRADEVGDAATASPPGRGNGQQPSAEPTRFRTTDAS
jgi:MFS family permease